MMDILMVGLLFASFLAVKLFADFCEAQVNG